MNWTASTLSGRLTALGFLLVLSVGQSATSHKNHEGGEGGNRLPACQASSALPSADCGQTPTPAFDSEGRLWIVFVQHGHLYVTRSDDLGHTFNPPRVVNRIPETIYSDGENRPKLATGPDGALYLSWSRKIEGPYAGDIRFSRSLDEGNRFSEPVTVNDHRAPISHRFDSMGLDNQGRIFIAWIDKRDLQAAKDAGEIYAGAAIYYAMSDDRGASFAFNRKLSDHSCECCRVATDADENGVVALWRHIYPVNLRDHAIARLDPDTPPIEGLPPRATDDGWVVDGCPHHGPDLSVDDRQKAHLIWFSQGDKNSGVTYGRFDLANQRLDFQLPIKGRASHPQVLSIGKQVIAAWKAFNGENTELMVMESHDRGESWSDPRTLASTASGSDHPFLIARDREVFVSWQTLAEGYRLVPVAGPQ
ncbi:sialidase family protein [Thiohalomonas denitrificans]|uniref:sialidase family protein n=1 Tax=Thiohalomonas denitrificans TaxID=415747 RepID=UPI0026ED4E26|nr:sialidase family protein [Thiohalomonas denitrificans]